MERQAGTFKAIVSSDWSECLSPSGPFDFIASSFPELEPELNDIFRSYTGNRIALGEACLRIKNALPQPVTVAMMDAYLDRSFAVYRGVPELIDWCLRKDILFMVNTTGMIGYFQRVFAKRLLPPLPVLSANPLLRFPPQPSDPAILLDLLETPDKATNTDAMAVRFHIPPGRIVVMGDSGGDGPHFEWGCRQGAFLIASMAKASLQAFCADKGIAIGHFFGRVYGPGEKRDLKHEMRLDFKELIPVLREALQV
jgi:hypothetical protein